MIQIPFTVKTFHKINITKLLNRLVKFYSFMIQINNFLRLASVENLELELTTQVVPLTVLL